MAASNAAKLNNYGITCLPIPFFGKDRADKQNGAANFKPKDGRKSLLPSRKLTLAVINKIKTRYGKLVKITYKLLDELAGINHTTAWRSLKELEAGDYIECHGESDYTIKQEFASDDFVVLYDFLLTEEINCGRVIKKLSRNAVIELCNVIRFYLNKDNKYKYFVGGDKRVASFLNVAQGTANGVVKELLAVGALTSHIAHYDNACNIILKPGKGKSIKEFTVYKVNPKLLSRCRRIQKFYLDKREEKARAAENAKKEEAPKQSAAEAATSTTTQAKDKNKQHNHNRSQRAGKQIQHRRRSVTEEWAETLAKLRELRPPTDNTDI